MLHRDYEWLEDVCSGAYKKLKLRITDLGEGNPPVADIFPSKGQVTRKMFPWCHHVMLSYQDIKFHLGDTAFIRKCFHLITSSCDAVPTGYEIPSRRYGPHKILVSLKCEFWYWLENILMLKWPWLTRGHSIIRQETIVHSLRSQNKLKMVKKSSLMGCTVLRLFLHWIKAVQFGTMLCTVIH